MSILISLQLFIRLFIGSTLFSNYDLPYSQLFAGGVISGEIKDFDLSEASGLVASRNIPGFFWVINDSGNEPKLFLINTKGEIVMSYLIDGVNNRDWEDIAVFTDKESGETDIFIADIGDNLSIRDNISVIKVKEPKVIDKSDSVIRDAEIYHFKYEDGARDAEALLIDPTGADLYIITKREENVRVYHSPPLTNTADTVKLIFQNTLPFHNITAADISADGKEILLKNYDAIFYFNKDAQETISEALSKNHEILKYSPEPQGESVAWIFDKSGYYTISERNQPKKQYLYFYKRMD